jgi:hypothetical protein
MLIVESAAEIGRVNDPLAEPFAAMVPLSSTAPKN